MLENGKVIISTIFIYKNNIPQQLNWFILKSIMCVIYKNVPVRFYLMIKCRVQMKWRPFDPSI